MAAALDDWRSAPVDAKLRATLGFLEKLTLAPTEVSPADAAALRDLGVTERALRDAVVIAALFNLIDRVADALGFEVLAGKELEAGARHLLRFGYRV